MIETVSPPIERKTDVPSHSIPLDKPIEKPEENTFTVVWDGKEHKYNKKNLKLSDEGKKGKPIWIFIVAFFIVIGIAATGIIYEGIISPDISIAKFILSESFDWFIVTVVSIILLGPFGIYGIYKFYSWLQNEFFKVRAGYIKVRRKLGNDRWKITWKKPIGSKIKAKTEDGINIEIPIKLEKDYVGWNGNIPFIEMDENLCQMSLTRTVLTIPQEHSTRMSYLAYLAGKISALKEQGNLQLLLIIAIIAIVGIGAFNAYTTYEIKTRQEEVSSSISQVNQIIGKLQNRTTSQPPTVGG